MYKFSSISLFLVALIQDSNAGYFKKAVEPYQLGGDKINNAGPVYLNQATGSYYPLENQNKRHYDEGRIYDRNELQGIAAGPLASAPAPASAHVGSHDYRLRGHEFLDKNHYEKDALLDERDYGYERRNKGKQGAMLGDYFNKGDYTNDVYYHSDNQGHQRRSSNNGRDYDHGIKDLYDGINGKHHNGYKAIESVPYQPDARLGFDANDKYGDVKNGGYQGYQKPRRYGSYGNYAGGYARDRDYYAHEGSNYGYGGIKGVHDRKRMLLDLKTGSWRNDCLLAAFLVVVVVVISYFLIRKFACLTNRDKEFNLVKSEDKIDLPV